MQSLHTMSLHSRPDFCDETQKKCSGNRCFYWSWPLALSLPREISAVNSQTPRPQHVCEILLRYSNLEYE